MCTLTLYILGSIFLSKLSWYWPIWKEISSRLKLHFWEEKERTDKEENRDIEIDRQTERDRESNWYKHWYMHYVWYLTSPLKPTGKREKNICCWGLFSLMLLFLVLIIMTTFHITHYTGSGGMNVSIIRLQFFFITKTFIANFRLYLVTSISWRIHSELSNWQLKYWQPHQ